MGTGFLLGKMRMFWNWIMAAQFCEYMKKIAELYTFKRVNFMVGELYCNKTVI